MSRTGIVYRWDVVLRGGAKLSLTPKLFRGAREKKTPTLALPRSTKGGDRSGLAIFIVVALFLLAENSRAADPTPNQLKFFVP